MSEEVILEYLIRELLLVLNSGHFRLLLHLLHLNIAVKSSATRFMKILLL